MTSSDSNGPFQEGVRLFKQEKFLESLAKFDEAIAINDQDKKLYDTRAAALEKLGRYKQALRDSKKVIDLDPKWWQGYARSARLFLEVNKPHSALRMVHLALERVRDSDGGRRAELVRLKERAMDKAQPVTLAIKQAYTFLELPSEIIYEIIWTIVGDKESRIFPLMLVCRRLRDIIVNMPRLWRHLTIGPKTTQKKAEIWISRARGCLSSLRILSGFDIDKLSNYLRSAPNDFWSKLESLEINSLIGHRALHRRLPIDAINQMRLSSLKLSWIPGTGNADDPLASLDLSRLSTIFCETDMMDAWKSLWSCTCLTTLHIKSIKLPHDSIYRLLNQNPNLETLSLSSNEFLANVPDGYNERDLIVLGNLHRIELKLFRASNNYLHLLRFPKLESLRLMHGDSFERESPSVVEELLSQPLVYLSELHFSKCRCTASSLIALLRALPKLHRFSFTHCIDTHVLNQLLVALARTNGDMGDRMEEDLQQGILYCPRLSHLDFTSSGDLVAGPLVQLVKSRYPARSAATDVSGKGHPSSSTMSADVGTVEDPLPIKTLILNDCPGIDTDVMPWLRSRVERIEFSVTPRPLHVSSRRRMLL